MERVICACRVTKFVSHPTVRPDCVFDVATNVIVDLQLAAVLDWSGYDAWVRRYSSSLESRIRYTLTDCFATYPFPASLDRLQSIGARYEAHRRATMTGQREGLTVTYNRFHSPDDTLPDIRTLRDLQVEMDRTVAAAYGWTSLNLGHGFHPTKQGTRFTVSDAARGEILTRLLALNHERQRDEVARGLHDIGAKRKPANKSSRGIQRLRASDGASPAPDLFNMKDPT